MPVNTQELLNAVAILADEENMKATVKNSAKGALVCASCCFVGGVLLGPLGLAVGGTAGGITAAYLGKGTFKPVSEIITRDLTVRQKEQLTEHIMTALRDLHPTDIAMLIPLIMGSAAIQKSILQTVASFITNEMRMRIAE